MIDQLQQLKRQAVAELQTIGRVDDLEPWRIKYLGKKGALTSILRQLGALAPEERRAVGQVANETKALLESELQTKEASLEEAARAQAMERERLDVTLPGRPLHLGQVHPTTRVLREMLAAFEIMGFQVVEGPEVETDYYNFEALNIPKDHPARDMWDTFYVSLDGRKGDMLLRTHTSPNQVRVMEKTRPPVRVVVPGTCYRYEAVDQSHEAIFTQVEGLAVDEHITFAHMKGTLTAFVQMLFGKERRTRFRCDYFPFVEPGAEMAMDCYVCRGAGCRLCGNSGWIEIMGAGMVHPKELERVGYDPSVYSGFAFGIGVERVAMLKSGIDDIRHFHGNDLRFLRQFR